MGLGIAGQLANAGIEVLLLDRRSDSAEPNAIAERAIERLLDKSQPGLLHDDFAARISVGNIDDDLYRLADADWIAEAVVERLDVKRSLYRQIDGARKRGSIVTSNTSTIPISLLVADMSAKFREEFAITHFFNPVRFMRLLELVRGAETKQSVIDCLDQFCESQLGKGIVVCNDTPGFLGNRVGVFAIQTALHQAFAMGLKPETADAIFGRPMGIPKTGVFGLYDLIGIDLMGDVAKSLAEILPEGDAFHEVSAEIPTMKRMIEQGYLGNKGDKGGFYRSVVDGGVERETLDFSSFQYRMFDREKPTIAIDAERAKDFTLLLANSDSASLYAWNVLSSTLCYAASLVPDVNESLVAIDDAMKLGYNWIQGPFEMIDSIGVDNFVARLDAKSAAVPDFLRAAVGKSFYRVHNSQLQYLRMDGSFVDLQRTAGVRRFSELRQTLKPIVKNSSASYFPLPRDIGLVEFHSKANTLDGDSMQVLENAIAHATEKMRGLVIHNDAQHFSCGVNLESVLKHIESADFSGLDKFLDHFQQTCLSLRYSSIPVVAAPSGLSLGGGFEVVLHTDKVVFHANSVTGLVESLVGVVPGGGGVKETLYRWYEKHGDMQKAAWDTFMSIGYGKTATSPLLAAPMTMFRDGVDRFVMNRDRLLDQAIFEVEAIGVGYTSVRRGSLAMVGRDVWAEMSQWLEAAHHKGVLTPHDVTTGNQIAMIVTGGDVDAGTPMSEQELCDLERKAFLKLAKTDATKVRIEHMLKFGTPLRN